MQKWTHPGGKLRELGAESLADAELLSILISTGTKGKPAEKVAQEILDKFGSFTKPDPLLYELFMDGLVEPVISGGAEGSFIRIFAKGLKPEI